MPSLVLCFPLARLTYPFKMTFWIMSSTVPRDQVSVCEGATEVCDPVARELLNFIDKQVSPEQNKALIREFSREEIKNAILGMANGKSPGTDGLPAEFYKEFFDLFADDLWEVFQDSFM